MAEPTPPAGPASDLPVRLVSGLAMAALASLAAWWGGWPFALFWGVAACLAWAEWLRMATGAASPLPLAAGLCAIVLAAAAAHFGHGGAAGAVLLAGAVLAWLAAGAQAGRTGPAGVLYAGAMAVPVTLLRGGEGGLAAVVFIFAVVWGSDIMAYFTGRTLGGPKLWPRVSPKKTWSGFVGGMIFGALAGLAATRPWGTGSAAGTLALGAALAVVSQGGDLFESALKRRFGTKDAGSLIPGHGGVMDRLDGFAAAAASALLVGLLVDPARPALGLLGL